MVGGEEGTSPSFIKVFVNLDQPDFDLIDNGVASQVYVVLTKEFDCVENPDGEYSYAVRANKFNNVHSLTFIITRNYGAEFSRIYYIGFTGIRTNKKKMILLGNYELKPLMDQNKTKDDGNKHSDLIYG